MYWIGGENMPILYDLSGMPVLVPDEQVEVFKGKIKAQSDALATNSGGTITQAVPNTKAVDGTSDWVEIADVNLQRLHVTLVNKGTQQLDIAVDESLEIADAIAPGQSSKIETQNKIFVRGAGAKVDLVEVNSLARVSLTNVSGTNNNPVQGDMLKSTYDINGNGIVDRAALADSVDWVNVLNKPGTYAPSAHTHLVSSLSNATQIGRDMLTASNVAAVRSLLNIPDSTTIDWVAIVNKPGVFSPSAHEHNVANLADATSLGKSILVATTAAQVRSLLEINQSGITIDWNSVSNKPTSFNPAPHTHTASEISNSSAIGRSLLTASDALTARSLLEIQQQDRVFSIAYPASGSLSALRVVCLSSENKLIYASSSDLTQVNKIVGVLITSASLDEQVRPLIFGHLTDSFFNWELNKPIFLGTNGVLTQAVPTSGFNKQIGYALTANSMRVSIQPSIIL